MWASTMTVRRKSIEILLNNFIHFTKDSLPFKKNNDLIYNSSTNKIGNFDFSPFLGSIKESYLRVYQYYDTPLVVNPVGSGLIFIHYGNYPTKTTKDRLNCFLKNLADSGEIHGIYQENYRWYTLPNHELFCLNTWRIVRVNKAIKSLM